MSHTHVDMSFPVYGKQIPLDHGYALYSAISSLIPAVHGAKWLGIQDISARRDGVDRLSINPPGTLRIRLPVGRIPLLLKLSGTDLSVATHHVHFGAASVQQLIPTAVLDARLVIIRLTNGLEKPLQRQQFDQRFLAEATRQLAEMGISGSIDLRGRGSIRVGTQTIIGHSVRIGALSADDSLLLQIHGLGGKRTMGCGIFRPARAEA